MSAGDNARTVLGISYAGRVRRAHQALRSRLTSGKNEDDLWPIGVPKPLGGAVCQNEQHAWGPEECFDKPKVILRGCTRCSAIVRVIGPPDDPTDIDALEAWLNS